MKIGIMGTRGIPNRYGGFEQFAEQLALGLRDKGHHVFVYSSNLHEFQAQEWRGLNIIHCTSAELSLGTLGQFIYDRNCLRDARKRNFDVLLHLGYTSDSVWHRIWPKNALNVVNMDGLEWKRAKYNGATKKFLKWAESLAAKHADTLIADNPAIKKYLEKKYGKQAIFIPYPAAIFEDPNPAILQQFLLQPGQYYLAIARMEPENNFEMIIEGYLDAGKTQPLILVGNTSNRFGSRLVKKYASEKIKFIGAVYDQQLLNNLRYYSSLYFHGHSVGGTNPSVLEAMACGCHIAAHGNEFNKEVLAEGGVYFLNAEEISSIINTPSFNDPMRQSNFEKIRGMYSLDKIVGQYLEVFKQVINHGDTANTEITQTKQPLPGRR